MDNEKTTPVFLNDLVARVKIIARNTLRAKLVASVQTDIYGLENDLKDIKEEIAENEKTIRIQNFKLARLEDEDPEIKDKTERYEKATKEANETISNLKKEVERLEKDLKEKTKRIEEIAEGKVKVSADDLAALTEKLLVENARQAVSEE